MLRQRSRYHDEQRHENTALPPHASPMTTTRKGYACVVDKMVLLTMSRLGLPGLAVLLCALPIIAAAQTITIKSITPFPLPPNATNFSANAINASGEVAGTLTFADGTAVAAVYSHGILTDLGQQMNVAFNTCYFSSATAINDAGQVAGLAHPDNSAFFMHAFLYDRGVVRDLGDFGSGFSMANGINASGAVVGLAATASGSSHAFLYSGGVMRDLGTLGGLSSAASAINDAGDVVGYADTAAQVQHAFLYSNGVMRDLGILQGGISYADARAINANGQITGEAGLITDGGNPHAFLYANGVMTDIGPKHYAAMPSGINASGLIVGEEFGGGPGCAVAFLYAPTSGILDLNSLLPPNSGCTLGSAAAINDAGQVVGSGPNGSFILTIDMGGSPVTTATVSGPTGGNGWYVGAVSVALSATTKGSSVAATYFSVDGAAYQLYAGPFPVAGDGTHQVSYYSVDTAGSQETAIHQTVRIDAARPVSHVAALSATALAPSFSVAWSGNDATSGIANYTIFAADNGGAFVPWIARTTATQATYSGVAGHSYGFYSIATDVAGNQEPAKTSPEAVTAVPARPVSHVAPLPATAPAASFPVQWSGTAPGVGIRNYTIYASDNGGAFTPWLSGTANTQANYSGVCEHNYGFYSIATDNSGLQEVAKTTAEATTRVPFNPVSHVLALSAMASSPNFNVQWSGVNTCTPIATWDIYVSDNGGAFTVWKARTSAAQAYFSGLLGHTYRFYSIAFDNGGGVEAAKSSSDAMTQTPLLMAADVNSDGRIDCNDVSIVKAAIGTRTGQAGFNARADLNADGVVDVRDLAILTQKLALGASCP
jgi:probable HAF family extracellular repeat protein